MSKKIHSVKILPTYFEAIISGDKTFEIRYNDRDYKVGGLLCLKEFCNGDYTGRETVREICYMLDDPAYCKEGYVVLGLKQSEGEWQIKSEIHQMLDDVAEELFVECPFCQRRFWVPYEFDDEKIFKYAREHYPYCNCGAKMKGGEADA